MSVSIIFSNINLILYFSLYGLHPWVYWETSFHKLRRLCSQPLHLVEASCMMAENMLTIPLASNACDKMSVCLRHQNYWILTLYCLCAAVSNVLSRSPHKLGETVLKVSALKPQPPPSLILSEPIDEERLLAKKLPLGCSLQELQTFVSRATASQILCWRIGVKPTTALLQFDSVAGIHSVCVHFNYDTPVCVIRMM